MQIPTTAASVLLACNHELEVSIQLHVSEFDEVLI